MGLRMSTTAPRNGEYTLLATDFTPEVMLWVRPLRSREMMERDSTTNTTTVSVRRDRRDLGTPGRLDDPSARGRGDQHPLECFELFETLPSADGDAVERITGHHDGHTRL